VQRQLEYLGVCHATTSEISDSSSRPAKAGQRWTREEDNLLMDMYAQRHPITDIASQMRRSEYSIFCRMEKLELYGEEYGYPSHNT